jgi:hypothetical protein
MHALWPLLVLFRPLKNSDVKERLKFKDIFKELKEYQQNWRNYLKSMERKYVLELAFCYWPRRRCDLE